MQADVKNWWNLPISNPIPDLHNIYAHTKFGENPLIFTQVIVRKQKIWTDIQQTDEQTPTWNHIVWWGIKRGLLQKAFLESEFFLFRADSFQKEANTIFDVSFEFVYVAVLRPVNPMIQFTYGKCPKISNKIK